ncbi:MAG: hypothetical protein EPO32_06240 [Anaerolineae bacterium]|nr:MAG: hypothetical protein EPO32_06240 [Anaerolineae bacterium]
MLHTLKSRVGRFSDFLASGGNARLESIWYGGLFALGAGLWVFFFRYGNLRLYVLDWLKEHHYLALWKEAFTSGQIPYISSIVLQSGDHFLANPEVVRTPDILLLRWLPLGVFVVIHVLILYALGCWGILRLKDRFGWPPLAGAVAFGLFTFSGALTARLGIGHFQWAGALLLPWFAEIVFQWLDAAKGEGFAPRPALRMSVLLFVLYLNGSFHIANWCLLFLVLLSLTNWRLIRYVALAVPVALLLAAHQIAPAMTLFDDVQRQSFGGFPNAAVLLEAFTRLSLFDRDAIGISGWGTLWWWEYDYYVGWAGLALLVSGLAAFWPRRHSDSPFPHLLPALLGMFVLSLGSLWGQFAPGLVQEAERVPTRFMLLVFLFLVIGAAEIATRFLRRWPRFAPWALLPVLGWAAWDLWQHAVLWRVALLEGIFLTKKYDPNVPPIHILPNADTVYQAWVLGSLAVSAVTLIAVVLILWRATVRDDLSAR